MKNFNIHKMLSNWGHEQNQLPDKNDELKKKLLAQSKPGTMYNVAPTPTQRPWLALALTGLAVILFFVTATDEQIELAHPRATSPSYPQDNSEKNPSTYPSGAPVTGGINLDNESAELPSAFNLSTDTSRSRGGFLYDLFSGSKESAPTTYSGRYPYPEPVPPPGQEIPITDNREFLKTDYYSTLRTRRVEDVTRHAELAVRGFGGRIDSSTISEKRGFVSFVVPAGKFESFRQEIVSLVGERFVIENITTQNLLPQKQVIEQDLEKISKTLEELKSDKEKLTGEHTKNMASINAQISAVNKEIASLEAELTNSNTPAERQSVIEVRLKELGRQKSTLNSRFYNENITFNNQLASLEAQIKNAENNRETVHEQDQDVLDTVATVRGTITVNWISIWALINGYLPPYWPSLVILAAAAMAYMIYRRRLSQLPEVTA